jgi:hypothetical protein
LDLSGSYPTSLSGNTYIVSFIDLYSGWPEAFAVPDKSADQICNLLIDEIFPHSFTTASFKCFGIYNLNVASLSGLEI